MWSTIIAVAGTLAGGTLSFIFQSRLAAASRAEARQDKRHAELLDACSSLGAALIAYRHSQLARRTRQLRDQDHDLSDEVRERRGDAWAAYFHVSLLTGDREVLEAAESVLAKTRELKDVGDLDRLDADADAVRVAIDAFIRISRDRLTIG